MTTKTTEPKRATSTRTCLGDDCPLRSTAENESYDHCPTCTAIERLCPSCGEYKPQAGFWWGAIFGRIDRFVCGDCRFPLDAEMIASHPDLAKTHPDYAALVAGRDVWTVSVDLDDDDQRHDVAQALARGSRLYDVEPAALVLARLAEALRRPPSRSLSVDLADIDAAARKRVEVLLHSTAYGSHTAQRAVAPIAALLRQWEAFAADPFPPKSAPLTQAQAVERERLAVRRGRERPV